MQGLRSLVRILYSLVMDIKTFAAETIANVARVQQVRRNILQLGGVPKLVKLLDCDLNTINLNADVEKSVEVTRCAALALWSCSKSTKIKVAISKARGIPLLARLLKSYNENMLIPVVGNLQEFATVRAEDERMQELVLKHSGLQPLVSLSKSVNKELLAAASRAIWKCSISPKNVDNNNGRESVEVFLCEVQGQARQIPATNGVNFIFCDC
ncbi:hypothetical protein fugu_015995 [Takifugu bimaculatus]|uniref:Armadillo repeat-containing domain-containing protein n=1 Tax=Takifugu bimaculatus TaxID=433685 RepID=A0A4Z2BVW2_9TELE|nr:hypothetical protein fugu_015995 [Takifugu bimaculatus]